MQIKVIEKSKFKLVLHVKQRCGPLSWNCPTDFTPFEQIVFYSDLKPSLKKQVSVEQYYKDEKEWIRLTVGISEKV